MKIKKDDIVFIQKYSFKELRIPVRFISKIGNLFIIQDSQRRIISTDEIYTDSNLENILKEKKEKIDKLELERCNLLAKETKSEKEKKLESQIYDTIKNMQNEYVMDELTNKARAIIQMSKALRREGYSQLSKVRRLNDIKYEIEKQYRYIQEIETENERNMKEINMFNKYKTDISEEFEL